MSEKEFTLVITHLLPKIYGVALKILQQVIEAEDVVQDVVAKLWQLRHKLSEYNNLEAFAVTITRNKCLDLFRMRHTERLNPVNNYQPLEDNVNPHSQMELKDARQTLERLLQTLPEQQKIIFILRDIKELETGEIEKVTGREKH